MLNSPAYCIIKSLIEKDLLVIQHQELAEWLDRLQSRGEIWQAEVEALLQLADELQIYDVPGSELVRIEELPFLEWVQRHKFLIDSYLG